MTTKRLKTEDYSLPAMEDLPVIKHIRKGLYSMTKRGECRDFVFTDKEIEVLVPELSQVGSVVRFKMFCRYNNWIPSQEGHTITIRTFSNDVFYLAAAVDFWE